MYFGGNGQPSYNNVNGFEQTNSWNSGFDNGFNSSRSRFSANAPGFNLHPVNYDNYTLNPIEKNFYHEKLEVTNRNQFDIEKWFADNQVTIEGNDVSRPVFEFNEASFPAEIERLLYRNYQKPTVIQSISWPVAMSGRDIISIARTGSGKTLGFLLPGIMHIMNQSPRQPGDGPLLLCILPTRELAQQVEEVARDYCRSMGLSITCLFGGASKGPQSSALRSGVDICVATPGRLLDFIETGVTNMMRCSYLVLDEADRMLDMGFEPQIRKIVSQVRPDRQTLMFSATWPKEVRKLASEFQKNAVFLNVGSLELSANHNIRQYVEVIDEYNKFRRLFGILEYIMQQPEHKTLIFVETKRKTDDLTRFMRRDGWPALCIHGDKPQTERDWVLMEFKQGRSPILVATDVAARGLDVSDIKYVINYDYPNNSEDYVHRIGRTGRRDNIGYSYTFFTPANAPKARDLIKVLREANQDVPPELQNFVNSYSCSRSNYGGVKRRPNGGFNNAW